MTRLSILLAMSLLVASCGFYSPEQRSAMRTTIEAEYKAGHITDAQRAAALEAIDRDEQFDWEGLGYAAVNAALAALLGVGVVRLQRGAPTQKVGLPATMVHEEPPIKRGVS